MRCRLAIALLMLHGMAQAAERIEPISGVMQWQQLQPDGTLQTRDTDHIPYEPDKSCYRWFLRIKPARGVATIQERLELPGPSGDFGDAGDADSATIIDPDHRGATTSKVVTLQKGAIVNSWCVAEGDPQGVYKIIVSQEGRVLWRFTFTVGDEGN